MSLGQSPVSLRERNVASGNEMTEAVCSLVNTSGPSIETALLCESIEGTRATPGDQYKSRRHSRTAARRVRIYEYEMYPAPAGTAKAESRQT